MRPTAATRVLALLGDPVEHSGSPTMHNAAIAHASLDGVYVALRCAPDDLDGLMRGLAGAGGGGNVTLPYKQRAASILDEPSEAVRRTGACNTFWGDGAGRLHGDNTDVEGFKRALDALVDGSGPGDARRGGSRPDVARPDVARPDVARPAVARSNVARPGGSARGARVLLAGSGGAARAVLVGLLEEHADQVVLVNRTPERALALARSIGGERTRVETVADRLDGQSFDLVVNATSVGLDAREASPIGLDRLGPVGAVLDLVYGQRPTPLVRAAEALGIPAADGAEMLVRQGAASFERWWGMPAPLDAMRQALS